MQTVYPGRGGGVPGVWDDGWLGEGLYRVLPSTLQDPTFSTYLALRPYPRPYEGKSEVFYEVPQIDLQIDLQNDPRMTPE